MFIRINFLKSFYSKKDYSNIFVAKNIKIEKYMKIKNIDDSKINYTFFTFQFLVKYVQQKMIFRFGSQEIFYFSPDISYSAKITIYE